jgi:hypothetical protein
MEFRKYDKIKRIGMVETQDIFKDNDIITIEEKLDGANTSFFVKDGNIIFGSRNQQMTSNEGEDTNVQKMFMACVNYVRDILKDKDLSLLNGKIVYGENMVKHTLNYDWEMTPPFVAFDIYDVETGKYLATNDKMALFEEYQLIPAPIISITLAEYVKEDIEESYISTSKYAPKDNPFKAEGVVIKNYAKQIFAKYVREEFKEDNKKVFGGGKKDAKNDDEVIVAKYCTNARINKQIYSMINEEGIALEMAMMKQLPNKVWEDIIEEEYKTILTTKYKLDISNIRKMVAKRCLEVLKQMIAINVR